MTYTIEIYLEKNEYDYQGNLQEEDRYIVVDSDGFDVCGDHMTKEEAELFIKEIS